jgi:hypothetical protein
VRTTLELPLSLQFPATVRTAHPTKNGILVFSKSLNDRNCGKQGIFPACRSYGPSSPPRKQQSVLLFFGATAGNLAPYS